MIEPYGAVFSLKKIICLMVGRRHSITGSKGFQSIRLSKNTHLLRCAHPSSLRRTVEYASFFLISRALHPDVFDQPGRKLLFQQHAIAIPGLTLRILLSIVRKLRSWGVGE